MAASEFNRTERAAVVRAWEVLLEVAGSRKERALGEALRLERKEAGSPGRHWPAVNAKANLIHTIAGDRFRSVADLDGLRTAHLIAVSVRAGIENEARFSGWRSGPAALALAAREAAHRRAMDGAVRP